MVLRSSSTSVRIASRVNKIEINNSKSFCVLAKMNEIFAGGYRGAIRRKRIANEDAKIRRSEILLRIFSETCANKLSWIYVRNVATTIMRWNHLLQGSKDRSKGNNLEATGRWADEQRQRNCGWALLLSGGPVSSNVVVFHDSLHLGATDRRLT